MSNENGGEKKLHIDSDWKEQMRAEKERLSREAEAQRNVPPDAAGGQPAAQDEADLEHGELPPPTFNTLVQSLGTQAMMFLSPQVDPRTGQSMQNLELAKHTVDLLSMLEEKTSGNLTPEEKRYIETVLYQVRMAYVQISNQMQG